MLNANLKLNNIMKKKELSLIQQIELNSKKYDIYVYSVSFMVNTRIPLTKIVNSIIRHEGQWQKIEKILIATDTVRDLHIYEIPSIHPKEKYILSLLDGGLVIYMLTEKREDKNERN